MPLAASASPWHRMAGGEVGWDGGGCWGAEGLGEDEGHWVVGEWLG